MKRFILPLAFVLPIILLSSCSFGNELSESTYMDNSSYNSSILGNSSSDGDDTFLVSVIPQDFYYKNEHFALNRDVVLSEANITSFFGYFINREDLEKWQEYDQSSDICYIIDENNSIYNYELTGELTNRFELFLTDKEKTIALKAHGNYSAYISSDN